ncbi:hypothetical protein CDD83_5679 [Cordyceps sp. RAO-2017]|nr:hypothetical protein CDD83_5679 [Cordyceps sp. RAO-2017]
MPPASPGSGRGGSAAGPSPTRRGSSGASGACPPPSSYASSAGLLEEARASRCWSRAVLASKGAGTWHSFLGRLSVSDMPPGWLQPCPPSHAQPKPLRLAGERGCETVPCLRTGQHLRTAQPRAAAYSLLDGGGRAPRLPRRCGPAMSYSRQTRGVSGK